MAITSAPRERILALDVFPGLTVAAMLLVNNPGSWRAIYAPLQHARWRGWTPTDLILPFFLHRRHHDASVDDGTPRARG